MVLDTLFIAACFFSRLQTFESSIVLNQSKLFVTIKFVTLLIADMGRAFPPGFVYLNVLCIYVYIYNVYIGKQEWRCF